MINFNITDKDSFLKLEILETLRSVIDPELQINIVDMGLIYAIGIDENQIKIKMTLSSKYCPMGESILDSVKKCLGQHYANWITEVELVWEPVWCYDNITEEGLKMLGR